MTDINRNLMIQIRPEIEKALIDVMADFGVELTLKRGKYGGSNGSFTLDMANVTQDGVVETKEYTALVDMLPHLALPENALNLVFVLNGESYSLTGYRSRARKRPLQIMRLTDGKTFVTTEQSVKLAMRFAEGVA